MKNRKCFRSCIFLVVLLFSLFLGVESSAAEVELKEGSNGLFTANERGGEFYNFEMKKDGYMYVNTRGIYHGQSLYTSASRIHIYKDNKDITDSNFVNSGSPYPEQHKIVFALKKGKYKMKVRMAEPQAPMVDGFVDGIYYPNIYEGLPNQYYINTSFKYVNDQGGSSKKRATSIKLGSYRTGLISHTDAIGSRSDSDGDWFKFKLTKKKTKVRLYMKETSNEPINLYVYGSKAKTKDLDKLAKGKSVNLPKGTYYIKVCRTSKYPSSYYRIGLNRKVK